ncbi:MAG: hypothetical protein V3T83_11380, partial [Acidobacteriota bacterium]
MQKILLWTFSPASSMAAQPVRILPPDRHESRPERRDLPVDRPPLFSPPSASASPRSLQLVVVYWRVAVEFAGAGN